ncbi:LuxR C-terminal-related transcriptional regulator [Hamadaea tsunoensis]|uniref:LuxR C-terminal-related transcriptional regulator n=1 Tax=Hamadaea tsunoensis TaxID=53368 RepID=UPI0004841CC3|nr:response regulator transcription factor [Hamadaea tsunoensis]
MRALVAEDQALLRVGLVRILEISGIRVTAAVQTAAELEEALTDEQLDIAIVDVRLPPTFTTEGLAAVVHARTVRPGLPVLVLSQFVEPLYARELLAAGRGAVGYLLKDRVVDIDGFVAAVHQVAGGGTVLDPEVVAGLVSARPLHRLTERERQVLTLMAEGRSNTAIAARLFVTEKAVDKHINNIFIKLDLPPTADDNRRVLAVVAWLNA